jgi:hypothetical protein
MKSLDLTALLRRTVLHLNKVHAGAGSSIQLSLSRNLSKFVWHDCSLEILIERLIHYALVIGHSGRPVRIAACRKAKLRDLEKFFDIHPSHWVQLHIDLEAPGFEKGVRQIFEDHGYQCEEWVGVEDSHQQLGAFSLGAEQAPKLLFWTENRRFRQKCDLLIPVTKPLGSWP